MGAEDIVVDLIALNGGELIGRTRLQKLAYLMHRCGAEFDLPFIYHRYGPYSFDLAEGVLAALADKKIEIEEKTGRYGVNYAIFSLKNRNENPGCLGELDSRSAATLMAKTKGTPDIVLELAATILFLRDEWDYYGKGGISPAEETRKRKPLKATDERIEKALALLRDLGIRPDGLTGRKA